jgi:putative DNA primase/helicase
MKRKNVLPSIRRIFVQAEGRDEWGNRYFKLAVRDSNLNLPPFSVDQISRDPQAIYSRLSNAGVNVLSAAAKSQLLSMLQSHEQMKPSFRVATRLGWNNGAIVRPETIIGRPKKPIEQALGTLDPHMLAKYRVRGTLPEWQENVARLCIGNCRLTFAVCLALTGPILRLVSGPRGGGFQFWGPPETGKSTSAVVAGSVFDECTGRGRLIDEGYADGGLTESTLFGLR